jgi:hypothetical protein
LHITEIGPKVGLGKHLQVEGINNVFINQINLARIGCGHFKFNKKNTFVEKTYKIDLSSKSISLPF